MGSIKSILIDCGIFKICNKMQKIDEGTIQRELSKLNIPFDMNIIREIHSFLDRFIGPLNYEDAQYHIPASCAILSQTIKIPTVNPNVYTSTGVKIENVMSHIGKLSKQKFLETVETQVKKSDFSNHSLIQKVGKIKIAFRVFKKYKTIFQNLSNENGIPFNMIHQLLAFFWIVFLIAKHHLHALEDLNLSTKILVLIIQEVFSNYYGREAKSKIRQCISQKDNFAELPRISEEQQIYLKAEIYKLFNSTLKTRDPSASPNCNSLLNNGILLSRLVDDLNSQYERIFKSLNQDRFIDEMTFLQLTKNLTPQAFAFKPRQEPISKVLTFDDDDEEMEDQFKTQGKKPNFLEVGNSSQKSLAISLFSSPTFNQIIEQENERYHRPSRSMSDLTPVSLGHTKAQWAKTFIKKFDQGYGSYIRSYFLERKLNFDDFVLKTRQKIIKQTQTLTHYIISNKQKQIGENLTMALCLTVELLKKKPSLQITKQETFNSILCISSYLYNSTVRYLSLELQKYSQIYKADLLDCLNILYDLSQYADIPPLINQILSELQKQVLIKELWDTQIGYKLLLDGKQANNESIFNRLERRIYERIMEICSANKVDLSEVKKIEALVKEIMQKKQQIFLRSKLDQIIICSISACLNLNQARYNLALSTIFQKYNSISLSLNSNRQCVPNNQQEGDPQSLLQFYNKVFIHKVQEMMSQQENPKYLYTPIRQNHLRKLKDQSSSSMGLSAFANRGMKSAFSGERASTYRKSIIQKMKEKSRDNGEDSEDRASPTFGTGTQGMDFSLKRKFTFGPSTD